MVIVVFYNPVYLLFIHFPMDSHNRRSFICKIEHEKKLKRSKLANTKDNTVVEMASFPKYQDGKQKLKFESTC